MAERHLEGLGYQIVTRNFRTRMGEIDLVAQDEAVLVFVEVKARRSLKAGTGAEAVTRLKQRKLGRMAQIYLSLCAQPLRLCRFDVVEVTFGAGKPVIRHLTEAFSLEV